MHKYSHFFVTFSSNLCCLYVNLLSLFIIILTQLTSQSRMSCPKWTLNYRWFALGYHQHLNQPRSNLSLVSCYAISSCYRISYSEIVIRTYCFYQAQVLFSFSLRKGLKIKFYNTYGFLRCLWYFVKLQKKRFGLVWVAQ